MIRTEQEAFAEVEKINRMVNRFTVEKLIKPLLYGVLWTDAQKTKASETIYNFFHENNAGYKIKEISLKTMYHINQDKTETKIRAWLERDGHEMSHDEMYNIIFRV